MKRDQFSWLMNPGTEVEFQVWSRRCYGGGGSADVSNKLVVVNVVRFVCSCCRT